ncbi:MAG: GTP pyrophosphokinase [candidate division CPR1 bacterium ADurb.Bin160]|uniref:GTP pyrophosphokinase n=1 Tax=candidate division CPR1 bacterium ADurb.Bin160 TaxID=1852826 RepID=A0A1V5ZJT3_9BACT|nr:MAG: GTP pyrophosphokinase [candidate division CPR1 bacterium ADurb.Bin160]
MPIHDDLVLKAKMFAKEKHKGQIRKFEQLPYFIHPKRVAHILYQFKVSAKINELVAAAYLHDVLEDTDSSYEELKKYFGKFVADIVMQLTSDKQLVSKIGKAKYLADKMISMTSYALTLKLADRIDNVNRLRFMGDEKFQSKYLIETKYIIERLKTERTLNPTQKRMIKEIETHLGDEAVDDIDYLKFDSYIKKSEKNL